MEALLYLISDDNGVEYIPVRDRIIIGGDGSDFGMGKSWLSTECLEIFSSDSGYGILRLEGPQYIYLNGMELPAGESYRLADGSVIQLTSPDLQDYFIMLFTEQTDTSGMDWMKGSFGEFGASRLLPFGLKDGQWMVLPESTDIAVRKMDGNTVIAAEPIYAGNVYSIDSRIVVVMKDGLIFTDGAPLSAGNEALYSKSVDTNDIDASGKDANGILKIDIVERSIKKLFGRKKLLQNIHLDMKKGQMVLILGQSGAGKTTFMNAVNGYEKAEGTITYSGMTIDEMRMMDGGIGFVPQGDILRPGMSVYKALMGAAKLKHAETYDRNPAAIREKVEHALTIMDLSAKRNELVDKLSGGEKKRLAVAKEYVGDPELFFLDEPDSGLDGSSAKKLMSLLRNVADEGRIVIIISHAPDRAGSMFDRIVVLGKDQKTQCGELAFYGSYTKALEFFNAESLEGIVGALDNKETGGADYYISKYAGSNAGREGIV